MEQNIVIKKFYRWLNRFVVKLLNLYSKTLYIEWR